jgi:hypothetical protein
MEDKRQRPKKVSGGIYKSRRRRYLSLRPCVSYYLEELTTQTIISFRRIYGI